MSFDSMGLQFAHFVRPNDSVAFALAPVPVFAPNGVYGSEAWRASCWHWQSQTFAWHLQPHVVGVVASPVSPPCLPVAPVGPECEQRVPAHAMQDPLRTPSEKHSDVGEDESRCVEFKVLLNQEDAKPAILGWISAGALTLALSEHGCNLVQKAIDISPLAEQARLSLQFHGHVMEMIESKHANYVLSKFVEVLPPSAVAFVLKELEGCEVATAKHRFGCRIWERLIEYCSEEAQMCASLDAIVKETAALCKHNFGVFVVKHIIEHGSFERRSAVLDLMVSQVHIFAMNRNASHVVQCGLESFHAKGKRDIVETLLQGKGDFALDKVACNRYGSFVVEQILKMRESCMRDAVQARLTPFLSQLQESKFGGRVATAMQTAGDNQAEIETARVGGA